MFKTRAWVLLPVAVFLLGSVSSFADSKPQNLDKAGVALQGYDPVSYFKSPKPQKGNPTISAPFEGAKYFFASDSNKDAFLKDPKKFAPQFGGWCAFAVADNKSKVEVDPESFLIQDGRLLLFYNGVFANTRKKWQKDPTKFIETADANWPDVEKKDP